MPATLSESKEVLPGRWLPGIAEALDRGSEKLLSSLGNDGVPFKNLVKESVPGRENGSNLSFQASFFFESELAPLQPNRSFTQIEIETGSSKFDPHLELNERQEGSVNRSIGNAAQYDRASIQGKLE